METLRPLYEFMTDHSFSIPLGQVVLYVVLMSIFILSAMHKTGLLVSYGFVLYWGYVFNSRYFMELLGETTIGIPIYIMTGVTMALLAIIGFFLEERR